MTEPTRSPQPSAVRLIFEYDGDETRLVYQQPVDVAIPGFDLPQEQTPGHHVEVRGSNEELLSRVPVRVGMTTSMEVFPERHDEPITRTELPQARGAFSVVVPVTAAADHVTLVRIGAGQPEATELGARATSPVAGAPEVVELGRFDLDRGEPR